MYLSLVCTLCVFADKGLVCILVYFRVSLDQIISVWFCLVSFVGFGDSFSTKIQEIGWKERLRNYLFCVERDEMPCSIHPSSCSSRIRQRQILSRSSVCRVHFVAVDLTWSRSEETKRGGRAMVATDCPTRKTPHRAPPSLVSLQRSPRLPSCI